MTVDNDLQTDDKIINFIKSFDWYKIGLTLTFILVAALFIYIKIHKDALLSNPCETCEQAVRGAICIMPRVGGFDI